MSTKIEALNTTKFSAISSYNSDESCQYITREDYASQASNLWSSIMRKSSVYLLLCFALLLSSCGPGDSPPKYQHTYTTNTQSYHHLTALRVKNNADFDPASLLSNLIAQDMVYIFIDGRIVAEFGCSVNYDSLVQLPPGRHDLAISFRALDVVQHRYEFVLNEDQVGEFITKSPYGGFVFPKEPFNNVVYWKRTE